MTWVDDTVRDFGLGMGIEGLRFNEQGIVCLEFEAIGTLFIERGEDEVLIYLVREISHHDVGHFEKALEMCHYQQGLSMTVNPGFRDEKRLVFLARMAESDFSLPAIEKTVDLLVQLHDKVST